MATDLKQTADQLQNQTLDYVRQGQDVFVKAVQTWSDTWAETLRQFVPAEFGDSRYFNPGELIDQWFDFGEQVLAVQREFAHGVIGAAAPAVQATEEATTRATKTAERKSTPTTK